MNYAALSSLCLAAVLGATALQAQPPSETDVAVEAAVKRQAKLIEVRNYLAAGKEAEARRETVAAAQSYNKALQALRQMGGVVEPEHQDAVAGLARTTLQLADQAIRRSQYAEAKVHIDRVLAEDPRNKQALEMRARNDQFIAETYDKTPTPEALATLQATETNRVLVAKMVQDGKLYYETGRLREAEDTLRRAIKMDAENRPAAYYLDLVLGRKYSEEARLREVNSKQMLLEVEQQWADPVKRDLLPSPNPYAHSNLVHTSTERQKIYQKLRTIRLNELLADDLPLSEVMKALSDEARKRDLENKGVNFLISPNSDVSTPAAALGAPAGVDPGTGLPLAPGGEPAIDLKGVTIKIGTPLRDVTLEQALNIITTVADKKIKYSIEDYGVVISPKVAEPIPLHTRFFKLDPNTFWQGLQNVVGFSFGESQSGSGGGGGSSRGGGGSRGSRGGGGGGFGGGGGVGDQGGGGAEYAGVSIAGGSRSGRGGQQGGGQTTRSIFQFSPQGAQGAQAGQAGGGGIAYLTDVTPTEVVIPLVRSFFLTAGVNLSDPGKAVFFNDRLGVLMVRATLQDLDTIEKAIEMLNMAPPQLTIRAKFMEVTQDDTRALGFDWFLGNTLMNNGAIGLQGGSAPSFNGAPSPANPSGVFPGPGPAPGFAGPFAQLPSATDNLVSSGLRNSAPAIGTLSGILTDPQFRFVVRALEQRGGTDLLSCPEVTTMSGRQAQIKVVDIRYVVTDLELDQTSAGGGVQAVGGISSGGGVGTTVQPIAEPFEIGPVLDVVPYVNADGYTIQLTILPTLKEFLGYDDPGQFLAQAQSVGASGSAAAPLATPTPLPKFRLRQVATTAMVWDGQTVVLGGLIAEDVQKTRDKIPVLGDLPLLGRFFRSEANATRKKNLVIFVTPTLIDPAGNRLHAEEEMPFAARSIPAQPRTTTP